MGFNLEDIYGPANLTQEQSAPLQYSEFEPKQGYGWANTLPEKQGLYNPEYEKDACGVGFTAYVISLPYSQMYIRLIY